LGDILLEMGNRTEAEKFFLEALAVARNAGLVPIMLDALLGSARLRAAEGSTETALKALAHIKDHPAGIETTKKRAETLYSQLQSELPTVESWAGMQTFREEVFHQLVNEVLGQ
jgi:hypothetical protein